MASPLAAPNIVDPHHFVLFQHGVLGYAGDFDNIIEDVLIDHQLAVQESSRFSAEQGGMRHTVSCSYHDIQALRAAASRQQASPRAPPTTTQAPAFDPLNQDMPPSQANLVLSRSATAREQRRRAARATFKLTPEYRGSGRVYEAGNLTLFAPGVNNFLRTNAGIHACTTRMIADFIPVFREWLGIVESTEADRARLHVRQQTIQATLNELNRSTGGFASESSALCDATLRGSTDTFPPSPSPPPRVVGDSWTGFSLPSTTPSTPVRGPAMYTPTPICFSCVGHSFGGILLREFLFLLLTNESQGDLEPALFQDILALRRQMKRVNITFENFTTLATPHCGVSECLWWPLKIGAYCLDKMRIFPTYGELLTSDAQRQLRSRLIDRRHLLALRVFRRRTLFANTQRDLLVGFGAASLIFEDVDDDHTKARGFHRPRDAFCASAFETDECEVSAPIYLPRYCAHAISLDESDCDTDMDAPAEVDDHFTPITRDNSPRMTRASSRAGLSLSRLSREDAVGGEVSKSVWLQAERDAAADRKENAAFPPQYPAPRYVPPLMPRHTYDDLVEALTRPSSPAKSATLSTTAMMTGLPTALTASSTALPTLNQPQARISLPPSPIAVSPLTPSWSEAGGRPTVSGFHFYQPPEAPAPDDFILRRVVQEHRQWKADEEALERQRTSSFANRRLLWPWGSTRDGGGGGGDGGDEAGVVHDATNEAMDDLDAYARVEQKTQAKRRWSRSGDSLSLKERTLPSFGELALLTSAAPRPLAARLTGWLLDMPLTLLNGLWRRIGGAQLSEAARPDAPEETASDISEATEDAEAPGPSGRADKKDTVAARRRRHSASRRQRESHTSRRDASIIFEEHAKNLPGFVEMPRSIAYHLRKHLDWRVRAIRYKNRIPIAHVACLGNWAWAGQSPDIVHSIAEEVLRIL